MAYLKGVERMKGNPLTLIIILTFYANKVFNIAQLKISKAGGSRASEFDIHHAVSHEIPTHIMDIA